MCEATPKFQCLNSRRNNSKRNFGDCSVISTQLFEKLPWFNHWNRLEPLLYPGCSGWENAHRFGSGDSAQYEFGFKIRIHGEHDINRYQIHSNTRYVHTHGPKRNWGTYFGTKGNQVMYVMSNSGTEFWENVLNTCEVFMTDVYGRWWGSTQLTNCELQDLVLLKKSEGPQWLDVKCS